MRMQADLLRLQQEAANADNGNGHNGRRVNNRGGARGSRAPTVSVEVEPIQGTAAGAAAAARAAAAEQANARLESVSLAVTLGPKLYYSAVWRAAVR